MHAQSLRVAVELGQVVEPGQGGGEARVLAMTDLLLDLRAAGEKPQPDLEVHVVIDLRPRLEADVVVAQRLAQLEISRFAHGWAFPSPRHQRRKRTGRVARARGP